MPIRYPYTTSLLSTTLNRPEDGRPIQGVHFNRLFQAVTALQATIGIRPQGTLASLKARLAVHMNDDGSIKQELTCDIDTTSRNAGSMRYFMASLTTASIGAGSSRRRRKKILSLPACCYEVPPVLIVGIGIPSPGTAYQDDCALVRIETVTEVSALVDLRRSNAANPSSSISPIVFFASMSRELVLWQDDVAWALPPYRGAGSFV